MAMPNNVINQYNQELYPHGLSKWSGHRDGGVRKPFRYDSGRPTGEQIETPLVSRLRQWVSDLVAGEQVPRVILLVGGPGNGKTDAVEGCIDFFDKELSAKSVLVNAFASKYEVNEGDVPPRKAVVDLSSLDINLPSHLQTNISLVQDATETDSSQSVSPEQLLLDELDFHVNSDHPGIFLCCVNRGILARTAEIAHKNNVRREVTTLLTTITRGATSNPTSPDCWPLDGYPHIAIWPMDVESLVDKSLSDEGQSVAHKIFESALLEEKWSEPCELNTRCPFCQNRKLLMKKGTLDSLIDLLHYYELISGKRWTFRDLFSLIPYLLIGDYSELEVKGKILSPCEWSLYQHKIINDGKDGSIEKDRAPYLLMSKLYHHRLFPVWPSLDKGEHRKAKSALLKVTKEDKGLEVSKAFFRYMSRSKTQISKVNGDVPVRIREQFTQLIDPAISSGEEVLISRNNKNISVEEIEDKFSLSVKDGLDLVGSQIEKLEKDVLTRLSIADESLTEDKFPRQRTRQAKLLQATIRQFSARLVKRSLGTKRGVCNNVEHLRFYKRLRNDSVVYNNVRRGLKNLLHDSSGKFRAGLATTFGQPIAQRSKDVSLMLQQSVTVKSVNHSDSKGRPIEYLPYLLVEDHYVALTFDLFMALNEVKEGLHEASLPSEIYTLLDRVKSLVSGKVVRDESILSDDPIIVLGSSKDHVEYTQGKFIFVKGS